MNDVGAQAFQATQSKAARLHLNVNVLHSSLTLKYQGESHHSLHSIDPAPNPTLRID